MRVYCYTIPMIKAVLFDMNGIIIDDEHIHEKALQETVKPFGVDVSHEQYLECCAGRTDRAGFESISTLFSVPLPIDELLKQKSAAYLELFPKTKKDFPGVIALIHTLSDSFSVAVTSSASRAEVELITKEFGINECLQVTVSADEVKKGKPDPEPYLTTARLLAVEPSECVVIEDSRNGVLSAKAAGCYCIGVTTTHDRDALSGADLIVEGFDEITSKVIFDLER